ncbi:MAG: IS630 family transposase [Gemmataceae bacterium]
MPPKKTVEEHVAIQAEFLETKLEPALQAARAGQGQVFFVAAAHFVMGAFLCCVWCLTRLFIRGGSGRKRYSVLGAWNAVTQELISITTDATVSAETMCALLRKIAALGLQGPITLVLDNARYQHCALVKELAKSLNIHLEFLPSYWPNLNLIERLWKFTKKQVLYGKHYRTFVEFCAAIDGCLAKIPTDYREKLNSWSCPIWLVASKPVSTRCHFFFRLSPSVQGQRGFRERLSIMRRSWELLNTKSSHDISRSFSAPCPSAAKDHEDHSLAQSRGLRYTSCNSASRDPGSG